MALTPEDINLKNFLDFFTFQNEVNKIQLDAATFVQIASLLKIADILNRRLK